MSFGVIDFQRIFQAQHLFMQIG